MALDDPCGHIKYNFCSYLPRHDCDQVWSKSNEVCGRRNKLPERRRKKETRHVVVTDGVPCRLWDIDPWLTPVSLFIPQIWCKCMNYMNILSNIKEVMHFYWIQKFDPYDPKWPRLTFDPKKIEGLKLMHMFEIHEYTMKNRRVNAFKVKIIIWPLWPPMTPG